MSELALRDANAVALQPDRIVQRTGGVFERDIIDGWVQVLDDVSRLANFIAETDFVPKALRNRPAAVAACILTGRELGIGPMQSLKSIHMVQGVPSLSAEYKRARALAAGHDITFDDTNGTRCVVRGRRLGTERWVTITWTMDMANRAKLSGKDVWRQYPQRMLQARASSELCDLLFPDASLGLATMEVLEDGGIVTESGEIVDAATGEVTAGTAPAIEAPKGRTAQRKPRTPQTSPPAADAVPPSAAAPQPPEAQAAAGGDLPPLPGEEEPDPATSGASSSARAPGSGSPQQSGGPSPSSPAGSASADDLPGSVTPHQLKAIWTILGQVFHFGDDEKDQARGVCSQVIRRPLASSKDMSKSEAATVIDTLAQWQNLAEAAGEEPRGYLMLMLQAAGDPRDQDGTAGGA